MGNNRLLELISRKLAGEATAEELEEIERILSVETDASENCKLLQRYWDQHENVNQFFVEEAFDKIVNRLDLPVATPVVEMHRRERSVNDKRLQQTAAAAAIIFIAGLILFIKTGDKKDRFTEQQTALIKRESPKGVKQTFTLPDGSKIWLNADSKIQFPETFNGNTRDVYLNGEAFFDVAKNPARPFIIHLANGTIRVLGTSFNVRAYDNEKVVETSVATGKVAFIPNYQKSGKKQDTVFLTPDNKVSYLLTKEEVIVASTVSKDDSAWIAGKLVFKGMTFEEIGMQLERNFGKKIVFLSDAARMFRMTGSFHNNSLEEILFYLSKSKEFQYKIINDEVLVSVEAN
jgi:transmembrane sensor